MNLLTQLEAMKSEGKKVVSIDFLLIELKGIPPTHHYASLTHPRIYLNATKDEMSELSKFEPYTGA